MKLQVCEFVRTYLAPVSDSMQKPIEGLLVAVWGHFGGLAALYKGGVVCVEL